MHKSILVWVCAIFLVTNARTNGSLPASGVEVAYFEVDVTPTLDSPLAFGVARVIRDSLSARGTVLIFDDKPLVLLAIDWIGVANEGMKKFRSALAQAVGTREDRVVVHALHQHDAVRCDFLTPRLLERFRGSALYYDTIFLQNTIDRIAEAARRSLDQTQPVTHIGYGQAKVNRVASNRRIVGRHGKVENMRWSSTLDFILRHEREGLIDPWLKMVTWYNEDYPLVSMSYYAVHPVTEFGEGIVSAEFVGVARKYQEMKRGYPQVYFTGAAGNIGVGKYNDHSEGIRYTLATRLSMAMDEALENEIRYPIQKRDFKWKTVEVYLPLAGYMQKEYLEEIASGNRTDPELPYLRAVSSLAWWKRVHLDPYVRISALHIGEIRLLSLPGEPFVEYQLMAQEFFPDFKVVTAGYEELGMGYIATRQAYKEGGYETSRMATTVSPEAEDAMIRGIRSVLK